MTKQIYFLAGLPRSGSTLLANILAQHQHIYVTPTSGIVDMLVQVRNNWDRNDAFQAAERKQSEETKERVLRAMLQAYFKNPLRFNNKMPKRKKLVEAVFINPPQTVEINSGNFKNNCGQEKIILAG